MIRLRLVLVLNAASCVLFGLLFIFAPASVVTFLADRAEAPPALFLVLGAGLLVNGLGLLSTAKAAVPARNAVLFFSVGDMLWVAATLILVATGVWINRPAGIVAALAVAAFVGTVGWLQWRALKTGPSVGRAVPERPIR